MQPKEMEIGFTYHTSDEALLLLFSRSVMSVSLRPHGLQQARPHCPLLSPRVCSNSIESVVPSNHLILCLPLFLLPSILHSIRVFSNESVLPIRWPKYWSFSMSPSNEYSRPIPYRIDWFDFLAVQRDSQESSPAPYLTDRWLQRNTFMSRKFPSIPEYWNENLLGKLCFKYSLQFTPVAI